MQSNMAIPIDEGIAQSEPTMAMQLGDQHPMSFIPQQTLLHKSYQLHPQLIGNAASTNSVK